MRIKLIKKIQQQFLRNVSYKKNDPMNSIDYEYCRTLKCFNLRTLVVSRRNEKVIFAHEITKYYIVI